MPASRAVRSVESTPARRHCALSTALSPLIIAAALAPAPAAAWQPVQPEPPAPRVPGFDMPAPPQEPTFPVLPGVLGERDVGPADATRSSDAPQSPTPPTAVLPSAALVPPPPETWDQATERLSWAGPGSGTGGAVDDAAPLVWVVVLIAGLFATAMLVLAGNLRKRGRLARGPTSIVRTAPSGAGVRRVDPRPAAGADRPESAPGTGRASPSTSRAAAAADSATPLAG